MPHRWRLDLDAETLELTATYPDGTDRSTTPPAPTPTFGFRIASSATDAAAEDTAIGGVVEHDALARSDTALRLVPVDASDSIRE